MRRMHRLLVGLIVLELISAMAAIGWRLSRPAPPLVTLSRLPATTAADIQRLQQAVWSDRRPSWFELGEAYLAFGYFAEAELCLRRSAEMAPANHAAVFAHACALDRLGRLAEANAQFMAAAQLVSGERMSNCWYHIGRNHLRNDDEREAESAFLRAGDYPSAMHERARLAIRRGKPSEALPLIEELRHQFPLDVKIEMLAVRAFRDSGVSDKSSSAVFQIERSREQLRLPNSADYFFPIRERYGMTRRLSRASELFDRKQVFAAAQEFQSVVDSHPPEFLENVYLTAARLHLATNRLDLAARTLAAFDQRLAPSALTLRILGHLHAAQGRPDVVREAWE